MTNTEQFDAAMTKVTQERGAVYGHPVDDFARVDNFKDEISECGDPLVRHALEMIAVKIARLIQSPDHLDSAIDIAGYARTICMIHDERARRLPQKPPVAPYTPGARTPHYEFTDPAPLTTVDDWIPWSGGERPVPADTLVKCKWGGGAVDDYPTTAGNLGWLWSNDGRYGDIIAYRVVPS